MIQQHIPNKNISVTKIPCSTKAFHNQSSMINAKKKKKSMPPQNFFILIPTKFCHAHEIRIYTCQQIFHIHQEFVQPSLHHKFFTISIPQNPSQHCQNSWHTNIVQVTPWPKNTTIQNAPKPRLQHDQSYNAPNFNMSTQQNDNVPKSNSQWNMKTTFFPNKETKKNSPWSQF